MFRAFSCIGCASWATLWATPCKARSDRPAPVEKISHGAAIALPWPRHVRFTPESGHVQCNEGMSALCQ